MPVIIPRETFDAVKAELAERAPAKTSARTISSPTLLAGIATCAKCGAGMTLRTVKGYRYYACAGRAQKGATHCGGNAVPMPKVEAAVIATLSDEIFTPDRLRDLVSGHLEQAKSDAQLQRASAGQLKADLTETEGAINRLVGMVEAGLLELNDPSLRDRLTTLKAKRTDLTRQITSTATAPAHHQILTEAKLNKLSAAIRQALWTAPPELRKAYIKMFVDKVVISREDIRMSGLTDLIAKVALGDLPANPAEVITFVRSWRPVHNKTGHWKSLILLGVNS